MNGLPIIRMSIEGMRQEILHAMHQHQVSLDEYVEASINDFCRPERIRAIIDEQVEFAVLAAIKTEAENYFRYGEGRKFIAKAVAARLEEDAAAVTS